MQPGERHIFERGCLRAGEEWIEGNLVPVAAVKVGIMVLQVPFTLFVNCTFLFLFVLLIVLLFVSFQNFDVAKIINEKGCLEATEEWVERNMISLATCSFVVLFLQVSVFIVFFYFCFYHYSLRYF